MLSKKRTVFLLLFFYSLVSAEILSQNYDKEVLEELKIKAIESHSDAVIIKQNDRIIYKDFFGNEEKPIYIASAGKSLVSLGVFKLLQEGYIDSLDQPVFTLFPEWKQGRKKDISIRMLLNHTSGMQNYYNAGIELEPAPDYQIENIIRLSLAAEIEERPGTNARYNNKAVALLGGVIEKASGMRMDIFFEEMFFKPMEIKEFSWIKDASGNPTAHGAFVLKPSDLLKFGELILNNGRFKNTMILEQKFINEMFEQGHESNPRWGLLWWRLPENEQRVVTDEIIQDWIENEVDEKIIAKIKSIENKVFDSPQEYFLALERLFGSDWQQVYSRKIPPHVKKSKALFSEEIEAYYASGFRGNFLVVVPDKQIVAVRVADHEGFDFRTDAFREFITLVRNL